MELDRGWEDGRSAVSGRGDRIGQVALPTWHLVAGIPRSQPVQVSLAHQSSGQSEFSVSLRLLVFGIEAEFLIVPLSTSQLTEGESASSVANDLAQVTLSKGLYGGDTLASTGLIRDLAQSLVASDSPQVGSVITSL